MRVMETEKNKQWDETENLTDNDKINVKLSIERKMEEVELICFEYIRYEKCRNIKN